MSSHKTTLEGRPSIFRRSTDEDAEGQEAQPTEGPNIKAARRSGAQTSKQPDVQASEQPDSQATKTQRIKATFYLEPADIVAIDQMQTDEFKRTGKKPERSHIVSRAVQLLAMQEDS